MQVARLVEENRGLRHRLAKYEASPQQARYKYARQQTAGPPRSSPCAGSRPASSRGPRNGGGGGGNKAPATGRSVESGGSAVAFEGRRDRHDGRGGGGGVSGGGTRNCGNPVSCLNSRESAAFADRVLHC